MYDAGDRADVHPHAELGRRDVGGARPRRAAVVDRGQEPRGLRVPDRPAGADPRARHAGAEGDLDGRHDAEPRERGAAVGGGQPLPQHAAGARGGEVHRDPARGAGGGVRGDHRVPRAVRGGDAGASTSRTSCSRRSSSLVLTQREIANQEKATFEEQQRAQTSRVEMEKAKGTADMQAQLASAQVGVQIKANEAEARESEGKGEAAYVELTGRAEATKVQAIGLAEAKATEALGLARADRVRGADQGARQRRRPRSSRSPTRCPRATSRWCPRCSSPAAAVGAAAVRRPRGDADALPVERWRCRRGRPEWRRPERRRPARRRQRRRRGVRRFRRRGIGGDRPARGPGDRPRGRAGSRPATSTRRRSRSE